MGRILEPFGFHFGTFLASLWASLCKSQNLRFCYYLLYFSHIGLPINTSEISLFRGTGPRPLQRLLPQRLFTFLDGFWVDSGVPGGSLGSPGEVPKFTYASSMAASRKPFAPHCIKMCENATRWVQIRIPKRPKWTPELQKRSPKGVKCVPKRAPKSLQHELEPNRLGPCQLEECMDPKGGLPLRFDYLPRPCYCCC